MTGSRAPDPRRIPSSSSAFVRQLAALNDGLVPPPSDAVVERLSGWFDWKAAIALSEALNGAMAPAASFGLGSRGALVADEREFKRVRASLAKAAESVVGAAPAPRGKTARAGLARPALPVPPTPADDAGAMRQRYVAAQQAMDVAIVALRQRLRASLATASPAGAKLAALDVVIDQVVGAREHELLATVPRAIDRRVARRQPVERSDERENGREDEREDDRASELEGELENERRGAGGADAPPVSIAVDVPDLARLGRDLRALLLAELDLRLQPVEGLLEAFRSITDRP